MQLHMKQTASSAAAQQRRSSRAARQSRVVRVQAAAATEVASKLNTKMSDEVRGGAQQQQ